MHRAAIRLSYSQILRLRRCPWAWQARHVRRLIPLGRKRPPPVWGDAYHVAAAVVWTERARAEASGWTGRDGCVLNFTSQVLVAARERLRELDVPGLDVEALTQEVAQAAVEACRAVGPEWRVLWLDGAPVVERHLTTPIGEVSSSVTRNEVRRALVGADLEERLPDWGRPTGTGGGLDRLTDSILYDLAQQAPVELVTVPDLALVHEDGRVRVVDHKTTTSWPEQVGDALRPDEDLDLDLRDDLQVRLYVLAIRYALLCAALGETEPANVRTPQDDRAIALPRIEGAHLVRRATIGREPPLVRGGRLSRAADQESTPEQWETAIRRAHLRREDYEPQIAQARLRRWQAWAPCEFTHQSLELARKEALQAAADVARYQDLSPDDVPRFRLPGRWMPYRPQKWAGLAPMSSAEAFAWSACAACDHRELCVAEGQGRAGEAALIIAGEYAHEDEVKAPLAAGELPPCELDADEVE